MRFTNPRPAFSRFAVLLLVVLAAVDLSGCRKQPARVDPTPFRLAIDDYLESKNMAMAIKEIKEGPVIEGDTARLTASLSHRAIGGPSVTWTFHFERQNGKWAVVKHED